MRCHTIPLEGQSPKPIKLTQYLEINIPAKPLANENVHRLLKPGTYRENDLDETCACCFDALVIFSKKIVDQMQLINNETMSQKGLLKR